jgi:hypothetical protein
MVALSEGSAQKITALFAAVLRLYATVSLASQIYRLRLVDA